MCCKWNKRDCWYLAMEGMLIKLYSRQYPYAAVSIPMQIELREGIYRRMFIQIFRAAVQRDDHAEQTIFLLHGERDRRRSLSRRPVWSFIGGRSWLWRRSRLVLHFNTTSVHHHRLDCDASDAVLCGLVRSSHDQMDGNTVSSD